MRKKDIEVYLAELGQELEAQGVQQPVRVLLIGGAFMLTQVGNRQTTDDIDVLLTDIEDTSTSPLYQTFKAAVQRVARRNNIRPIWLNDVIGDFLKDVSKVPNGNLWRGYGKLEVLLPPEEYILALKLLAGREKDEQDILALCQQLHVQEREQAQMLLDRYIPDKQLQQASNVEDTLDTFFKP